MILDIKGTALINKNVLQCKLSGDGQYLAAVVEVTETALAAIFHHKNTSGESTSALPPSSGLTTAQNGYEVVLWSKLAGRWLVLGSGDGLRIGDGLSSLYIDWGETRSLFILSSSGALGDYTISSLTESVLKDYAIPSDLQLPKVVVNLADYGIQKDSIIEMRALSLRSRDGGREGQEVLVVLWSSEVIVGVEARFPGTGGGGVGEARVAWREVSG